MEAEEEKAKNMETIAAAKDGQAAVAQALVVLKEFYAKYDINDMEVPQKYSTNAAAHWRERLKTIAEGENFSEPAPDY